DTNMNVTQETLTEGAGFPGSVHNQKDITYQTISGNYVRPASETLTAVDPVSGSFVMQGKTVFTYDDYDLTSKSGVPNHNGNTSKTGRGNLTSLTRYKDASHFVTEHIHYDSVGNVIEKDDGLGHATQISYNDNFCSLLPNSTTCDGSVSTGTS